MGRRFSAKDEFGIPGDFFNRINGVPVLLLAVNPEVEFAVEAGLSSVAANERFVA